MNSEQTSEEQISVADIGQYDWQHLLTQCQKRDIRKYVSPLIAEAERLKAADDLRGYRVFKFLAKIASLWPDYGQKGNPYEPPWKKGKDLSHPELDLLEACSTVFPNLNL